MKQCRFGLCPNLDADLISEIEQIANGGSWNEAARFYLRFLHRQAKGQNVTPERQNVDNMCTDNDINLSKLDDIFSEFEE
jgi:hypothetical protein